MYLHCSSGRECSSRITLGVFTVSLLLVAYLGMTIVFVVFLLMMLQESVTEVFSGVQYVKFYRSTLPIPSVVMLLMYVVFSVLFSLVTIKVAKDLKYYIKRTDDLRRLYSLRLKRVWVLVLRTFSTLLGLVLMFIQVLSSLSYSYVLTLITSLLIWSCSLFFIVLGVDPVAVVVTLSLRWRGIRYLHSLG